MRKAARMKHKTARVRSRLDELMFGTLSVCTAAVNAGFGVIGLQDSKRERAPGIVAPVYFVYFNCDRSGVKGRKN